MLVRFMGMLFMGYFLYVLSIERKAVERKISSRSRWQAEITNLLPPFEEFGLETFDTVLQWGYEKLEGSLVTNKHFHSNYNGLIPLSPAATSPGSKH